MAVTQITTSISILQSLIGYQAVSLTNFATSALSSISQGSKLEVSGAFFTWGADEVPGGWAAIATSTNCYLSCVPSGTAGSQIITSGWISTVPVWSPTKQSWYASAASNIRVIGGAYKTSPTQQDNKWVYDRDTMVQCIIRYNDGTTNHSRLTGSSAHGAVSTATASQIVTRDAAGRASVAAPSASSDIAILSTVTDHAGLTGSSAHGATAANTASQIVTRGASGEIATGPITVSGTVVMNAAASAIGGVSALANTTAQADFLTFGSSRADVVFGITAANYSAIYTLGAASLGLLIGTYTAKPLIFGTNNTEWARLLSTGWLGLGTPTPGGKFDMLDGTFILSDSDVAHGMTDIAPTNAYAAMGVVSATEGGLRIYGLSDTGATNALLFTGILGHADPTVTVAAIVLQGNKKNGTTYQALAATETVLKIDNYDTDLVTVLGNGRTGFLTTRPLTRVEMAGSLSDPNPENILMLSRGYNAGVSNNSAASFAMCTPNSSVVNTQLDIKLLAATVTTPTLPDTVVMTLLSTGKVGVMRTPTTYALEVAGDIYATGVLRGAGGVEAGTGNGVWLLKTIDIGDWNMDTTEDVTVAHGLTLSKIRMVYVAIRSDTDNIHQNLDYWWSVDNTISGNVFTNSGDINLHRVTGKFFDNANYDSTSYNRGWIHIWYIP